MYSFTKDDKEFRNLTNEEIEFLKSQGCSSQSWDKIFIKNVDLTRIKDVQFHGKVKINALNGMVKYHNKVQVPASINRATLIDVFINGNVYINNVGRFIANYKIENGVIIENAGSIYMERKSSFGNGVETSPIMEGDGRSVKIFNRLNSHIAYMVAMYRHRFLMRARINAMIDDYTAKKTRRFGKIKEHAKIINARLIKNSHIDPYTTIENTDEINNTTVISTKECPSYIGTSVILKDSIVLKGAHIVDSTVIKKAFIGEGVKLGRQFSCEDSLLFANCEGEHGEMFSIFAGPYTVTHHKATLLIASHFSFFNAGSGTNQSNHMYKLGPYHHGFMERGCKTGSNSYMLSGELVTKLTGRYIEMRMTTLTFEEYLKMKAFYGKPVLDDLEKELNNYILEGGFPRAVMYDTLEQKRVYVQSVVDEIFDKDIKHNRKIRKKRLFDLIMQFIINNFGCTVSVDKLTANLKSILRENVRKETVYRYINEMENLRIISRCSRFDLKSKRSLRGDEKYYLSDLSFYFLRNTDNRIPYGPVLENIVYQYAESLSYSVSVGKIGNLEVDFILRKPDMDYAYVQVAMYIFNGAEDGSGVNQTEEREYRSLEAIRDSYPKFLLTLDHMHQRRNGIVHANLAEFIKEGKMF